MSTKRTTISQIAKMTGYSSATVSRVLSNSSYPVNEQTKSEILSAAQSMNYVPNAIGRMLKQSVSRDIGIIIPNVSNPFYTELVLGAERAANARGYSILLCNSMRNEETEQKYVRTLCEKQVGGILISSVSSSKDYLTPYITNGVSILDLDATDTHKIDFCRREGAMKMVSYLASLGHRRIAFASSPLTIESRRQVFDGYKDALNSCNIPFDEGLVVISKEESQAGGSTYEFTNGRALAEAIGNMSPMPTAVFAANDMTAIGIIQRLSEMSVRVPEDISVAGFDNIEVASMVTPALTTANQSAYSAGFAAISILIDEIEEKPLSTRFCATPSLEIRSSTSSPSVK